MREFERARLEYERGRLAGIEEAAQVVERRVACNMCGGKGVRKRMSFMDHRKTIPETCHICRGDGKVPELIDPTDIAAAVRRLALQES